MSRRRLPPLEHFVMNPTFLRATLIVVAAYVAGLCARFAGAFAVDLLNLLSALGGAVAIGVAAMAFYDYAPKVFRRRRSNAPASQRHPPAGRRVRTAWSAQTLQG